MAGQPGFFDLSDRYEALSAAGDPLERLSSVVDFEVFRGPLIAALRRSVRGKGGRPPFDPVLMFKILVLQALYSLSDEGAEFQIKDRLSFQRFLGLGLDGTVPDATTVWLFRERLVQAKAIDKLFARFDAALTDRGYALVPALGFVVAAPLFLGAMFSPSLTLAWLPYLGWQAVAIGWLGPVVAAIQQIVLPRNRATASAAFLCVNNIIGYGFGPFVMGFLSDRMTAAYGDDALRHAMLASLAFYGIAAIITGLAVLRLKYDWYAKRG